MSVRTAGTGGIRAIALHGWFGAGNSWDPTVAWLDPSTYTVAMPDYRGYGDRIGDRGEYTLAEIAADTLALADELGWESFDLIGHSMGGKAAQLIAATAPARVRRVVAVTPVPPGPLPFDDATREVFRGAATDMEKRGQIIASSTGHRNSQTFVDTVIAQSRQSRTDAFAGYFESWVGDDITAQVDGATVPIMVVAGEHDNALTADTMRAALLPYYRNAELQVIAAAGHYPIFETPVALATAIDSFLNREETR